MRRPKKEGVQPARPTVTADRLVKSVRQQKQRIVLLKAATEYLATHFLPAPGAKRPKALLQDHTGRVEPADHGVVNEVTLDLEARADGLHRQLVQLLAKNLDAVRPDEVPVIEPQGPADAQLGMPALPTVRRDREEDQADARMGDRL